MTTSEIRSFRRFILRSTLLTETEYNNLDTIAEAILNEEEVDGLSEYELPDLFTDYSIKLGFFNENDVPNSYTK